MPGDQLHRMLDVCRPFEPLGLPRHHHAAPMQRVGELFDLKADRVIGLDHLGLRALGREEVDELQIESVVHRHDVRAVIARASQMTISRAQQERQHLAMRHLFNLQHRLFMKPPSLIMGHKL